jgi:hypothetical protein
LLGFVLWIILACSCQKYENSCVLEKDSQKDLNLSRICFIDYSCLFLSEICVLVCNDFCNMTCDGGIDQTFSYHRVASLNNMGDIVPMIKK